MEPFLLADFILLSVPAGCDSGFRPASCSSSPPRVGDCVYPGQPGLGAVSLADARSGTMVGGWVVPIGSVPGLTSCGFPVPVTRENCSGSQRCFVPIYLHLSYLKLKWRTFKLLYFTHLKVMTVTLFYRRHHFIRNNSLFKSREKMALVALFY